MRVQHPLLRCVLTQHGAPGFAASDVPALATFCHRIHPAFDRPVVFFTCRICVEPQRRVQGQGVQIDIGTFELFQACAIGRSNVDVFPFDRAVGLLGYWVAYRSGHRRLVSHRLTQERKLRHATDKLFYCRSPFVGLKIFGRLFDITITAPHRDRVRQFAHDKRGGLFQVFAQYSLDGIPFTLRISVRLTAQQSCKQ
ncbi:hypothetical protein D3C76_1024220 [compost metagenome]